MLQHKKAIVAVVILSISPLAVSSSPILNKNQPTSAPTPHSPPATSYSSRFPNLSSWQRPDGPPKIGLQIGHLEASKHPEELKKFRNNSGTSGGGFSEPQVVKEIADQTKSLLQQQGFVVEILPATIPPGFWADAFVSIHADGSLHQSTRGFKVASPRRDYTGLSQTLSALIHQSYAQTTNLPSDPNITKNMRGYYAFSWWRYHHAIHPMTPAVILETGFLTNSNDRKIIVDQPQVAAQAIAQALITFINSKPV